jgi:phytoene dehydrogenase-like protein
MTAAIENQVERFAPGFKEIILERIVSTPQDLERRNPNLIGGDIGGGANDFTQLFSRPLLSLEPWSLPIPGHYICSASTLPGAGVHGMCGVLAAESALKQLRY